MGRPKKSDKIDWVQEFGFAMLVARVCAHPTDRSILEAIRMAGKVNVPAGFKADPLDPAGKIAYINLPTGELSWHLPYTDLCASESDIWRGKQYLEYVGRKKREA